MFQCWVIQFWDQRMSIISGSDCRAMCHVSVETEIIDKISASQDITILDMGGSYGTCGLLENKLTEKKTH